VPLLLWVLWLAQATPVSAEAPTALERFTGTELVLRSYLTLEAVDARGRRPFRPDAVLARYLVEPGSAAPRADEDVKGESGEARWSARTAGEDGRLADVAWAYARVESDQACVVLAKLAGAATLFVNGAPHAGDLYGYGFGGVPVALVAGTNELYVTGVRDGFRLSLVPTLAGARFGEWDFTLPTLVAGAAEPCLLGCLLFEAALEPAEGLSLGVAENPRFAGVRALAPGLTPLGSRHVALALEPKPGAPALEAGELELELVLTRATGSSTTQRVRLAVRAPDALRVHTRLSPIDGSVQKYAVLGPTGSPPSDARLRLLLSLHGAGVDCEGEAASYARKSDFVIVAPTNRRPFGFDWQDWGRLDAYETLADALEDERLSPANVHLSGHSMGGHGTWLLAANDPDGFASIAPSAGWRSFDTYGNRPEGELKALWLAADAASRVEDRIANLAQLPTFVLHGEADDNVPAAEGHAMVAALTAAGAAPLSHFEPGAGHWWDDASGAPGTACLDWPGFFELFRRTSVPEAPQAFDWTSVDPGVDARHAWVTVAQPLEYGRPFHVVARASEVTRVVVARAGEGTRVEVRTENVRRLRIARAGELELDGQSFTVATASAGFARGAGGWTRDDLGPGQDEKSPERSGPLKRAFERDFVLVVPTRGTPPENASALARALYDQEQWSYRANGDAELVTDAWWLGHARETKGRNVLLYGNADTNAVWAAVVPADFPVRVGRERAALGAREWSGAALGVLAIGPRADGAGCFGLLASSGAAADRVAASLALFVSGVGYPDYVVYGPEVLTQGDAGVRAAGFFDRRWRLPEGKPALGR
jgi:dienelactone hydrolase